MPASGDFEARLCQRAERLLGEDAIGSWETLIRKRDLMYERALNLLKAALERIN